MLINHNYSSAFTSFAVIFNITLPVIIVICWVLLLNKDIKKAQLHYVITHIVPSVKKKFIKEL